MTRRSLGGLVLLVVGVAAAVSCGGSDDAGGDPADSATADSTATGDTSIGEAAAPDSAAVDGARRDAAAPDSSDAPIGDASVGDATPRYDGGGCPTAMREIPAATFMMGSTTSVDERPVHAVRMDAYCMDTTEVTVDAYSACVAASACAAAAATTAQCNAGVAGRGAHPINCVSWVDASAFCAWKGLRLPTEEEWEYAARGVDGRTYPWGNDVPAAQLCWSGVGNDLGVGNRRSTCVAGSYPLGKSPFDVLDLAGNVMEWTASGYSTDYNKPRSTTSRVFRGGSWSNSSPVLLRSASRVNDLPTERNDGLGFRCVL